MGSPFGDPIFMPALSWRHGSARLRRYGMRMAECDNSDEGGSVGNGSVGNGSDGRGAGVGRGWRSRSAGGGRAQVAARAAALCASKMTGFAPTAIEPGMGAGRKARSAMPQAAGRCRGKAGQRWQVLRAMRDIGPLDAKRGPWRQDSRAMYPESPDCTRKWIHKARILPF